MKRFWWIFLVTFFCLLISKSIFSGYGKRFCSEPWVTCIKIKSKESWESLWPDPYQREIVKKLNRMNIPLYKGMIIAVPKNVSQLQENDIAPFAKHIRPFGMNTIIVSPAILAWGAYDPSGNLVRWGPISGGKDYCPDVDLVCRSKTGIHNIYDQRGPDCISTKFPVGEGGAPMPYCMFYYGGYALHGSPAVPGYHASHGCIRLFIEDARWLNQEFVDLKNTKVIVLPY